MPWQVNQVRELEVSRPRDIYIRIHIYIYVYVYICMYGMCVRVCVYIYTRTLAITFLFTCIFIFVCISTTYDILYMYMHTRTWKHVFPCRLMSHILQACRIRGAGFLRKFPPVQLGPANATMSLVSVPTVVEAGVTFHFPTGRLESVLWVIFVRCCEHVRKLGSPKIPTVTFFRSGYFIVFPVVLCTISVQIYIHVKLGWGFVKPIARKTNKRFRSLHYSLCVCNTLIPETGPPFWKPFLPPAILRPCFWGRFWPHFWDHERANRSCSTVLTARISSICWFQLSFCNASRHGHTHPYNTMRGHGAEAVLNQWKGPTFRGRKNPC